MSDVELGTEPAAQTQPNGRKPRNLDGALIRYRVMAYVVGTGLVILVCVGIPLQVWAHSNGVATYVGIAHGYLFMLYLVLTFDLARRARWNLIRVAWVGLAGTIPFLSFYAERVVTRWVRADKARDAA